MYADISETEYREFGLQIRDLDSVGKVGISDVDSVALAQRKFVLSEYATPTSRPHLWRPQFNARLTIFMLDKMLTKLY